MTFQDLVNGSFELLGGVMNALNVWTLYKHKEVKGVHWAPTTVFTLWGYWNLYYYPHLDQWMSFVGGIGIVTSNCVWLCLAIFYLTRKPIFSEPPEPRGEPPCWVYGWHE